MQTVIEISEEIITQLDRISRDRQISRDEIVQTAISRYLDSEKTLEESFGLWAGKNIDGIEYQQRMRGEW